MKTEWVKEVGPIRPLLQVKPALHPPKFMPLTHKL